MLRIKTKGNIIEAEFNRVFEDELSYIYKLVDIQSVLGVSRENRLTDREQVFFVATVVCVLNGYDNPITEESIQIYKNIFQNNANKKNISDYIGKISKKKWIKYDKRKKTIIIPPIFNELALKDHKFDLNLDISLHSE